MSYVVAAVWTAREGTADAVAAAVAELIAPSRAEPGNLVYEPHRDPADPNVFFFYERYADRAAYDAHAASEHFVRHAIETAIPLLASRERAFYVPWDEA